MPYNGSGTYSPPGASFPAVPNTLIMSTKFNNVINDIATALSTAITKDGQTTVTANLPMGGYRHTGVGAPSTRDHYATVATVQDSTNSYAVSGGAADVQTLTLSPAITAYSEGMLVGFRAGYTNTSSTPTLNVNGVGAKTIVMQDGSSLAAGAITAGRLYLAQYYNNNWRLILRDALPAVPVAGKILRSNGSAWVASTGTYPDSGGTAGTLLRADGTNWVATTATFPTTVTGAGQLLRASGANTWAESTATYPDTVTSAGQILRASGANAFAASTMTYPNTITSGAIPYATSTNVLGESSLLTASGDGTQSTSGMTITGTYAGNMELLTLRNSSNNATLVVSGNGTASGAALKLVNTATPTTTVLQTALTDGSGNALFTVTKQGSTILYFDNANGPYFPGHTTTASAANAYLDSGSSPAGHLMRSTSSLRYKRDVEPVDAARIDAVMQLEPIWYRSKCEADRKDWSWYGLGAEEVAAVDPRLVHWTREQVGEDVETVYDDVPVTENVPVTRQTVEIVDGKALVREVSGVEARPVYDEYPVIDASGKPVVISDKPVTHRVPRTTKVPREIRTPRYSDRRIPDGVMYERVAVLLLGKVKQLEGRLRTLEAK